MLAELDRPPRHLAMLPSQSFRLAFVAAALMANLISSAVASPYALPLPLVNRAAVYTSTMHDTSIANRQVPKAATPFPVDVNYIEQRDGPDFDDLLAALTLRSNNLRKFLSSRLGAHMSL